MLSLLKIKNFAVIKEQEIEFSKGLNVITGETGAGKSILLQALSLILGARPKAKFTRKGAECWEVEALFDLTEFTDESFEQLPEIAKSADRSLILYRSGGESKNKVMINGKLATASLLSEITQGIINICGQGEFVTLLDTKSHLLLLDEFAGITELRKQYQVAFEEWKSLKDRLAKLAFEEEQMAIRKAELEFVIEELIAVKLEPGLRQNLEAQVQKIGNVEGLLTGVQEIVGLIDADHGIERQIQTIVTCLHKLQSKDSTLQNCNQFTSSMLAELEALRSFLTKYESSLTLDPKELDNLRDQLADIARLERKYRLSDSALVALLEESKAKLLELGQLPDRKKLEKEFEERSIALAGLADKLSTKRKKFAKQFETQVVSELQELSMPSAILSVNFKEVDFYERGKEQVEFMVSTNKGQDSQALKLIASGGELARVLLVLKKLLRDKTGVNVLVFDEVDSGVSGKVARAVGEKLKALSKDSQVLCITHLAQVASLADHHIAVRKSLSESTETVVSVLAKNERLEEIALMLSGHNVTKASRASAKELLENG